MPAAMKLTTFREVNLDDPFFDSLKLGYREFSDWFARKAHEQAYVTEKEDGTLRGFLYLKMEVGAVTDVQPALPKARWLKVGTLKIDAHRTKLGERYVKKIFDFAIREKAEGIYVTVFEEHAGLIRLFKRYGFNQHSTKTTANGVELVLIRDMRVMTGDSRRDYPFVHQRGKRKFILGIYPEWHTKLLPDSILNNEDVDIVEDLSFTNTIHKSYVCRMNVGSVKPGDILVIYRTTDRQGHARWRSVVSSICVVEEVRSRKDFRDLSDFLNYTRANSVFTDAELTAQWAEGRRLYVIRMTYNAAFRKRVIREKLLTEVGLNGDRHFDIYELNQAQFEHIARLGEVDESIIVN